MSADVRRVDQWLRLVIASIFQFTILTFIAMFLYAGGNDLDPDAAGYVFTRNFFSALGQIEAYGEPNTASAVLFFAAMLGVGLGLLLFFLAYPRFFSGRFSSRFWSLLGSVFGAASAAAFIGVAFTPTDVYHAAHVRFVAWAFRLLPMAIACYTLAIHQHRLYPNRYAAIFAVFTLLLAAYLWLISAGPGIDTAEGLIVQAVGQKIIAYASLMSVYLQANGARALLRSGFLEGELAVEAV